MVQFYSLMKSVISNEKKNSKIILGRLGFHYLQNTFRQSSLLAELLQIFSVRVVVDREVGLHCPQLVVLEARTHALSSGRGAQGTTATETHLQIIGIQI